MKDIYMETRTKYKQKNVFKYDDMKRCQHMAVRKTAGWYLWTHQLMEVTGPDSAAFLDYACPNPIANLNVGRERYTTVLNHDGIIIDDVVVMRMAEQKFWVSTLFVASLIPWMESIKQDYVVEFRDISDDWHMYAVQGPNSLYMVNDLVEKPVNDLKFFAFTENKIDGKPVLINRAGFTGEKVGYEIYIAADEADFLEEKLAAAAGKFDALEITEFQIMAWTLPTEAGYYYMRDLRNANPIEVGLDRGICWEKEFIGKEALLKVKEAGPAREIVGFTTEDADAHIHGRNLSGPGLADPVYKDGELVGYLLKFVYSYVKETCNGTIIAKKGALQNGDVAQIRTTNVVICDKVFL